MVYCDPPYVNATRSAPESYLHDFADDDHARLADALKRFKATRVLVSYYRSPVTDALYAGWKRLDWPMKKAMSNTGGELQYAKVYLEAAASLSSSILEEAEYLLSHPRTMRSYRSRSVERIAELARGIQVVAKIGVEGPVKAKEQAND